MAKTEATVSAHSGFLSLEHAAQYADVSVKTVKRWIVGGLPKYQAGPGSKVLIRPGDIERFLLRKESMPHNLHEMVEEVFDDLTNSKRR